MKFLIPGRRADGLRRFSEPVTIPYAPLWKWTNMAPAFISPLISYPNPKLLMIFKNGNETSNSIMETRQFNGSAFKDWMLHSTIPAQIDLFAEGERVISLKATLSWYEDGQITDVWAANLSPDQANKLSGILTSHADLTGRSYITQLSSSPWAAYAAQSLKFSITGINFAAVDAYRSECERRAVDIRGGT